MPIIRQTPKENWSNDNFPDYGHPVWWLAFDVLTNLCKWECARPNLIAAEVPALLFEITKTDSYFGFEATEGLAYLVGGYSDMPDEYLQPRAVHFAQLFRIFESANGNDRERFFGMEFGFFGRILAIRRLAQRRVNHELLVPCVPFLIWRLMNSEYDDNPRVFSLTTLALADILRDPLVRAEFVKSRYSLPTSADWTFALCSVQDENKRPVGLYICLTLIGENVNRLNNLGSSPLFYAVRNSFSASQTLLALGARMDLINIERESVLSAAIGGQSWRSAELILKPVLEGSSGPANRLLLDTLAKSITHASMGYLLSREGFEPSQAKVDLVAETDSDEIRFQQDIDLAYARGRASRFMVFLHIISPRHPLYEILRGFDENIKRRIYIFFVGELLNTNAS